MGWPSVEAGLRDISSRELSEWIAYCNLYGPINPNERMEWMIATLTTVTVNMWRDKDSEPAKVTDFLPQYGQTAEDNDDDGQSPEHMLLIVEMLNAAFGGVDLRGKA